MHYKKFVVFAICFCLFLFLAPTFSLASNLQISSFGPSEIDTDNETLTFTCNIYWYNSWRNDENYDAAWIFMKYKAATWQHATMAATGVNPTGFFAPQGSEIIVPPDRMGFFIQKAAKGTNTGVVDPFSCGSVKFVWDYGADGLSSSQVQYGVTDFELFGIEMVYIPEGPFYAGDGGSGAAQFEEAKSGDPKLIDSEEALTLGGGAAGALGNNNAITMQGGSGDDDFNDTSTAILPPAFPKGYNAFYLMKYMISQGQYRDFLNTISSTQSSARCRADDSGDYCTENGSTTTPDERQTIKYYSSAYGCDLDDDNNLNETVDGEWIACNYLSGPDLLAYADWAALRPMTELEYEKAARGPLVPVSGEYAWGTTDLTQAEGAVQSSGTSSEVANTTGNGLALYDGAGTDIAGPLRVGFAASSSTTTRISAAVGYYGNANLSDNLMEICVIVGDSTGRAFIDNHGDGELDSTGDANVESWPESTTEGFGYRGGAYITPNTNLRISDREYAAYVVPGDTGGPFNGGRCARTAP